MGNNGSNNKYIRQNSIEIPTTNTILSFPKQKDDRYGGDIYIDYTNYLAYKIIQVPAQQLGQGQIIDFRNNQPIQNFDFIQFLQSRIKLRRQQPRLLTATNYRVQKGKSELLCSFGNRQIIIQYPYPIHNLQSHGSRKKGLTTLQDKIMEFCKERRPYPQNELRDIFYKVVSILQFLKNNKTCHGDIKPRNIIFSPISRQLDPHSQNYQLPQILLIDSYLANIGKTSYQIVLQNPQSLSLLSPQLLKKLNKKSSNNQKQKVYSSQNFYLRASKTQMFAIGLCLLQATTAQNAMQCYDLVNLKIKDGYFDNKADQMRRYGYSTDLIDIVFSCLGIGFNKNTQPMFNKDHMAYKTQILPEQARIDFRTFLARIRSKNIQQIY